jgi:hypothetical protein
MDPGEQITGTRDEHYDLISTLFHALKGAENCDTYALDAEAAGRADLYEFFREAQLTQTQLAERAKELLGIGVGTESPQASGAPPLEAPLEADVPVDVPPGDVPPRSADPQTELSPTAAPETTRPEEDIAVAPAAEAVPPDAPRTEDVPPRTGEFPPSPSE